METSHPGLGADVGPVQSVGTQPRRTIHRATVTDIESVTPTMRRLTVEGEALATLAVSLPAQWLKVMAPGSDGGPHVGRAYTIRRFYPGWRTLELDIVLHRDGGPLSTWAARVPIGDEVMVGGARGGFRIDPSAEWRLLVGDETALPAIASIFDALSRDGTPTRAIVEVPSPDDAQPLPDLGASAVEWLARRSSDAPHGRLLERAVEKLTLPPGRGQIFLAGEATAVRAIRTDLAQRAPDAVMDAKGYWASGRADHRDRD